MIKPLPNLTYRHNDSNYVINQFQEDIFQKIKMLPQKSLYYLVGQQSSDPQRTNLNLKELKYLIRRGITKFIRETTLNYHVGMENELVKYFCVFETNKVFNESQNTKELRNDSFYLGLHFHLFFSTEMKLFNYQGLIHSIFLELTSIPNKRLCLNKYDYERIYTLEDSFILYHTKQFYQQPDKDMILTNI